MALDTNIALGVKPIEQPNMLAQMGQMMQLRSAQQEYEGQNALRDAFASGGSLSDPTFVQRLRAANPKMAFDLEAKHLAGEKTKSELLDSAYKMSREYLTMVNSPEGLREYTINQFNDPVIGPSLKRRGLTPEKVLADLDKNIATLGFNTVLKKSAMGLEKFYSDETSRANAATAAGPGNRQASLAEQEAARKQQELGLVRGILTGGATPPTAPPVVANAPMSGGGGGRLGSGTFNIPMGGGVQTPSTGTATQPNVLATQVAPTTAVTPNVNALNPNAPSRVDQIKQQLTQLSRVGGPVATQAIEGLVKEYNVLNPAGKIEIDSTGTLRTIDERSGTSKVITGADGKPVKGNVTPIIKSVLDQTDPAGKRMIDVNVNEYVQGTGLGADGKGATPKGVIGISNSQIPPNYMIDPANPQGLIPVPGSAADPNASVPSGYRKTATGFEPIPGGPADPNAVVPPNYRKKADGSLEFIPGSPADPKAAALLRGPRAGYKFNAEGDEVRIPQTGVPEGVRLKPDERWNETKQVVEQVPGSAAFIEQQTKHGKDLGALKTTQATTKWGTERIDKILDPKNKTGFENNFGGFTAYATKELSGNTALVKAELDSLKSDLKNKGLQMFRAGGSIGAMTEKEWPIVESMLATLTPKMDVKDAREVLEAVRAKFEALENLAAEKYNDQWKGTQYHKPVGTTSSGAGASAGATSSQPIYATNGKDRIMSTDGGNTWTPVGAK